ncbi:MAG TPA: type II CAAX endopeptidase family protein [Trueperaceae bacterium]
MFPHLSDPAKAVAFYVISLLLGLSVALTPGASTFVYMFTPLVAVLIMMLVVTREGYSRAGWASLGLHRLGLGGWRLALLAPLLVVGLAFVVLWVSGAAGFAVPAEIQGYSTRGWFWLVFPVVLLLSLVVTTLTNSLGEELGWRGYLLPRLEATVGPIWAMFITGLLHALWHLPFMLLTSLYHPEGSRLIVLPLFFVTVTAAGFLFGYLRLTTRSVWPAALAHSAHNLLWDLLPLFTLTSSPLVIEYLAGDSGVLVAIGYGAVAVWAILRFRGSVGRQAFRARSLS